MCIKLPYRNILEIMKNEAGTNFNEEEAKNSENVKWVMTAWEDCRLGGCDYINGSAFCLEVVDAIPNEGAYDAQATDGGGCHRIQDNFHRCMENKAAGLGTCTMDEDGSGKVDLAELNELKLQFFKGTATQTPCDEY